MDLNQVTEQFFTQELRNAIEAEDMVATRQLIDSVTQEYEKTGTKETVRVYAESYILELRDGEQYKRQPTLDEIKIWIEAKGLTATLNPYAVWKDILENGTTWDEKGGSQQLKSVINEDNIQSVMNLAVNQFREDILNKVKWL